MNIVRKLKKIWERWNFAKLSPNQRAEAMRSKFYFLGKNVKLYTDRFGTEPYLISIHDNVICAANVSFINHDVSCFNIARYLGLEEGSLDKVGPITLYDNCFIGAETMLMMGCSVGKNSIIAARSVVTKKIPDNEVWGGVPAKFIMTVDEYASRVKKTACAYPWMDPNSHKKINMSEDDLIAMRQLYFFDDSNKN